MRLALRILAAVLLLGAAGWWIQAGANRGWTKNSVAVEKVDEVTEITYREYEDRFVPGVDFLAAGAVAAAALGGLSLLRFGRRKTTA